MPQRQHRSDQEVLAGLFLLLKDQISKVASSVLPPRLAFNFPSSRPSGCPADTYQVYQGRCRTPDSIKSIVVLWSLLLLIPGTTFSFTSARIFLRVSSTSEFTLVLWNCFKIFTHFSRESSFAFLAGWVDEACSGSGCEKSHLDLPCPPGSIVLLKRPPGQNGGKTCYFTTVSQYQCTEYTVIRGKCEITEASHMAQSEVSHSRKRGWRMENAHSRVGPYYRPG